VRPKASVTTNCALPAPVMPGMVASWNGPGGSSPLYWRMPLTYRSTADGTATSPRKVGSGVVMRYGCRPKSRPMRTPPRRRGRVQSSWPLITSPTVTLNIEAGADQRQLLSRRTDSVRRGSPSPRWLRVTAVWLKTPAPRPKARSSAKALMLSLWSSRLA
jgi:hypothetical protein